MKNLDLNAYGVSEMNVSEMEMIDGGNIFKSVAQALESAVTAVGKALQEAYDYLFAHGIVVKGGAIN